MFHSIIITGGDQKSREEAILTLAQKQGQKIIENNPDVFLINQEEAVGINIIRQIKTWLGKKAYQEKNRLVLIYQAQQLTTEAQNAFLKTLEEPPENTIIILAVNNSHQLLPTIASRCQIIRLKPKDRTNRQQDYQELVDIFHQDLGKKILFAQKKGKEERKEFLNWLEGQSQSLRQKPTQENLDLVARLTEIKTMIRANIAPRLGLAYWLIKD
ncbi:MAG: hypothetical protein PHR64_01065 [Candidatus Shapirobacteria bacterium]|nr:hypothetical protein [Candidatus Shapirobacteria bacterium]MDD5073792.1 hypothetical protein [Candidatus Shapirobacteria bacterium]MDD5481523.1 hypothetical protein [Candidatus Shapirobacteria bacterium]